MFQTPPIDEPSASRRSAMVRRQLVARGIRDPRVLAAFGEVPRERFLPQAMRQQAYDDGALPIGCDQTISQPYVVAVMTEALRLTPAARVLEVGTGSGYGAAILGRLAREVLSVERVPELAQRAAAVLAELGCANVRVLIGDGARGLPDEAPFDAICVTAAAARIPLELLDQLAPGGRLVLPVGEQVATQTLLCIERGTGAQSERFTERELLPVRFVPLVPGA